MTRILFLSIFLFSIQSNTSLEAQTRTFRGTESALWDNPFNWEPFGFLPTSDEDVVIDPTGPHTNVELNIDEDIRSLEVKSGTLTVQGGKTLTISNSGGNYGLKNATTLTNNGTIHIVNSGGPGIQNSGNLLNTGGMIRIDNTGSYGFHNQGSAALCTNDAGTITINGTGGLPGIFNQGNFNNENAGHILLGQNGGNTGSHGIENSFDSGSVSFSNRSGSIVQIDNSSGSAIVNGASCTINNSGGSQILIGQSDGNIGGDGIKNPSFAATVTNDGGTIKIGNVAGSGISNVNSATFNNLNSGLIEIGQDGTTIGMTGIDNRNQQAVFTNDNSIIKIDNTGNNAYWLGHGLMNHLGSIFDNRNAAQLLIGQSTGNISRNGIMHTDSPAHPLPSHMTTSTVFNNASIIKIDQTEGAGIKNLFLNRLFNRNGGQILFGQNGGNIGEEAIKNEWVVHNEDCYSLIHVFSDNPVVDQGNFVNAGLIVDNASGNSNIKTNNSIVQNLNGGTFTVTNGNPALNDSGEFAWLGCVSSDWTNPENWSGGIVPNHESNVLIFNAPNDPEINTVVQLKSVHVVVGAQLTIQENGTLEIDGATANGLLNEGTILNQNFIGIGNGTLNAEDGIRNFGVFTNAVCATMTMSDNLHNEGSFTNNGHVDFLTSKAHTNTGTFINNGLVNHVLDNPIHSVTNNEIIIQPTTANACDNISPAFQLGNPIDFTILSININPDGVGSVGDFDVLTNTFTPNTVLEEGTRRYYVVINIGCGDNLIVPWELTTQNCCDSPEAVCQPYEAILDENGLASITPADVDGGSTADCGLESLSIDLENFDCSQIGTTQIVELTITDLNGDSDNCTANVTVSGLPCGFVAPSDGVNCAGGNQAAYDPNTETYTIISEGCYDPNYYSTTDALGYIGTTLCGDGEVIVQVTQVVGNGWAGITMREGSSSSDKMLQLMIDGVSMSRRELRQSTGGTAFAHQFPTQGKNWLRLTRTGNTFGAYHSADGTNWQAVLITNILMANCIEVGMITANSSPSGSMTATFENFEVISLSSLQAPNVQDVDIASSPLPTFEVFPNPAKSEAWIRFNQLTGHFDGFSGREVTIEVYNNIGQRIYEVPHDSLEESRIRLNVANWLPGMYLIQLKTQGQPVISKKLIVSD